MRFFLFVAAIAMTGTASARDYSAGQLWSYQTRAGDESSLVLIDFVESVPKLGTIYHISVLQVHMPSWKDGSRSVMDLPHFPVSKVTLDNSLLAPVGTRAPFESYKAGYAEWRKAFDAGQAGVFTISVADVIATVETALLKNMPAPQRPSDGHSK